MVEFLPATLVRWAGGVMLLAVALVFAPGRATAECGSYVTILDGRTMSGHAAPSPIADHPLPKAPCHGPGCSNDPSIPFTPLPAPASPSSDTKACFAEWPDNSLIAPHHVIPPSTDDEPLHQSGSIFHPPRG